MSLSMQRCGVCRRGPTGYRTLYSVYGALAAVVSFLLMILQAIAARYLRF